MMNTKSILYIYYKEGRENKSEITTFAPQIQTGILLVHMLISVTKQRVMVAGFRAILDVL